MSQLLIQHYLNEPQTLRRVSGTSRESVVREAFKTLLKDWGRSRDLIFIPEYEYQTLQKTRVRPDGALLHALRVPLGYWEAKDEEDDLDEEIEKKFRKGYPQDNIIFDDSHEAVLIQDKHAQDTINPSVTVADVREMLIQHVLTEEIFSQVFDDSNFHRQNNVAKKLYALENTFFTGKVKHDTLAGLRRYYAAIKSAAALVTGHREKQNFLKTIYENFYKVYDKKKADRLGVVYTPTEIVRFMVESADWLCHKHFGKSLIDKQVEILDPAAGTGTFITELIEHFRGQPTKLRYKYLEELHANEVAILPYYVANLNIEATYAAINGYEEYPNLCFVDTLDNTAALKAQRGQHVGDLFGAVSEENVARIKRQNKKKISVVIGNPPYNANQLNENENNKNREYPTIDAAIKDTYIAASDAQKTKLYDMYVRFFRWASDRINENGVVAFVSNSSFIHKPSFDGFRKTVAKEFNEIWIVDLKGDARTSGERRRREGGNIFGDQIKVGIAVSFFVKRLGVSGCRIRYEAVRDYTKADEKSDFLLRADPISKRHFEELKPDKKGNLVSILENDFDTFLPIADKATKSVKITSQERAIFRLYSLGISTNRDEWLYDFDPRNLESEVKSLIADYERIAPEATDFLEVIKWSRNLKRRLYQNRREPFTRKRIVRASHRPYVNRLAISVRIIHRRGGFVIANVPTKWRQQRDLL